MRYALHPRSELNGASLGLPMLRMGPYSRTMTWIGPKGEEHAPAAGVGVLSSWIKRAAPVGFDARVARRDMDPPVC